MVLPVSSRASSAQSSQTNRSVMGQSCSQQGNSPLQMSQVWVWDGLSTPDMRAWRPMPSVVGKTSVLAMQFPQAAQAATGH